MNRNCLYWCWPALLGLASPLSAQWLFLDGPIDARVAYDSARRHAVALGNDGGTWEWHGSQRLHRAADGPGQRSGVASVYDSARSVTMLFGGSVPNVGNALGDTWLWDGVAWSQPFSLIVPPRRIDGGMAFDAGRGRMVLFSGRDPNVALTNDVWEDDGSQWQRIAFTPPGPPAGLPTVMAYDPVRGEVVVVLISQNSPQTWSWDGARWALVASGGPTGTVQGGMAFDTVRSRLVLLVPVSGGGQLWELQGSFWTMGPLVPGLRLDQASLYFSTDLGKIVIQGGRWSASTNANTTLWTWDGTTAQQLAPAHSPERRGSFAAAYDPVRARTILFGGGPTGGERGDLWEWDGQSWTARPLPAAPGPRERAVACFDTVRNAVLLFGGRANNVNQGDTWMLDATGWTQLQPAVLPPPTHSAALAWDPVRNRGVLFGGIAAGTGTAATWEWDGNTWQQRFPPVSPSPRSGCAMAYDPVRQRMVLYGGTLGTGGAAITETWEWDGTTWLQIATAQHPTSSVFVGMAFDPVAGRVTMAGAFTVGTLTRGETWQYDGTNWSQLDSMPTRDNGSRSLLLDSGRGNLLLLDGEFVSERAPSPAAVASFGQGCGAPAPLLQQHTRPRLGQQAFGLELWTRPSLPMVWVAGYNAVTTPIGAGCNLLVQPVATLFGLADAQGLAQLPLALPYVAGWRGLTVLFQGAALDPSAPAGFAVSAGLRAVLGD